MFQQKIEILTIFCFVVFVLGNACGQDEGTFGSDSLKPDRNHAQSGARILVCCLGTGSGAVCTVLVPLALETAT